jgi:Asp/Glu/hydantoin racemase
MEIVSGGRNLYGFVVGVLMLETRFPRLPGDIGNATTWPFPVLYRIVPGATPTRVVDQADPALIEPFVTAAGELVEAGCRVITTSCGFLAILQRELARAVPVPVATSALLQVPMVARLLSPGQKVGILTARSHALTERHFSGVGWSSEDTPVVVAGLEDEPAWCESIGGNRPQLDRPAVEAAVVRQARQLAEREPGLGAFVLECTNLPPYAAAIQRATGRPVFDIVSLVSMLADSVQRREFAGSM